MQCAFFTSYYNYETKSTKRYHCKETVESSKLCIFHDKENFKKNIQKINAGIKEKINYAIRNNRNITMIGYNIAEINMSKKKFDSPVIFVESIFHEDAFFQNSEFMNHVDFSNVQFKKNAIFNESNFQNNVYCIRIKIEKDGIFSNCIFKRKVNFNSSKLHNCRYFNCTFTKADFSSILFTGSISFHTAIFNNEVDFSNSKFETVNFNKARFCDEVNLDAEFSRYANIHNVIFSKPEIVNLAKDLSKISFLGTDITRMRFTNETIWNNEPLNPFG